MMTAIRQRREGFSLVETMIGVGVMALVITGGLVAIGQTTLISEKSSEQVTADFILRSEVEALRSSTWNAILARHNRIATYEASNPTESYPDLSILDAASLEAMGMTAEVTSARLSSAGETGKVAFRVWLTWQDRAGNTHDEARVLIITEGGVSADT